MEQKILLEKVHKLYRELTEKLIETGLTVSTMESCTCGLIASLITDTVGASAVFLGGVCVYSNEVKLAFDVPAEVIEKNGVYSEITAEVMAKTIQEKLASDLAVGVTGSLCSVDGTNADSVPGEVYLSVTAKTDAVTKKIVVDSCLSRFESKLYVAEEACKMLGEMTDRIKKA